MVNSSRTVKLADFGMTRPMFESDYYRFSKKGMLMMRRPILEGDYYRFSKKVASHCAA